MSLISHLILPLLRQLWGSLWVKGSGISVEAQAGDLPFGASVMCLCEMGLQQARVGRDDGVNPSIAELSGELSLLTASLSYSMAWHVATLSSEMHCGRNQ